MKKGFLVLCLSLLASWSQADTLSQIVVKGLQDSAIKEAQLQGLDWKVGDNADYKLSIGGFINGSMHNFVREETAAGIWMQQDMDLGFMGKQKIEVLFDKATGQVLEMYANGQKQNPPDPSDMEVVEMKEAQVTVPAGSFECIYARVRNNKDNTESEAWLNPQRVPMSGMLKQLAPSQFGQVDVQLTAFQNNSHRIYIFYILNFVKSLR